MTQPPAAKAKLATTRPIGLNDLPWSAKLHKSVLPNSFFARLGVRFLRSYHRSFSQSPYALAVLVEVEGEPAGFAVGTLDGGAHYSHALKANGRSMAVAGATGLFTHPKLLVFFVRTRLRRYLRGAKRIMGRAAPKPVEVDKATPSQAELVHIAIDPKFQGMGLGTQLLTDFEDLVRARGIHSVRAKTNTAANFYLARGWVDASKEVKDLDGRPFVVFTHDLTGAANS